MDKIRNKIEMSHKLENEENMHQRRLCVCIFLFRFSAFIGFWSPWLTLSLSDWRNQYF